MLIESSNDLCIKQLVYYWRLQGYQLSYEGSPRTVNEPQDDWVWSKTHASAHLLPERIMSLLPDETDPALMKNLFLTYKIHWAATRIAATVPLCLPPRLCRCNDRSALTASGSQSPSLCSYPFFSTWSGRVLVQHREAVTSSTQTAQDVRNSLRTARPRPLSYSTPSIHCSNSGQALMVQMDTP